MAEQRKLRIAGNEIRFREINEALRADLDRLPQRPDLVPFVCECAVNTCADTVELTFAEYERVRASSRRFVVHPGHVIPDAEDVVEGDDRYMIVEKHLDVSVLVEATDPRGGLGPPPAE